MNVKYQIFVSSTYEDLKAERAEVIKACLNMGHIPVGMEMFNAADEEQWAVITRTIDQCDYYVVIVAHRYGSTVEGISFTEKEYDYAIAQGVPVLGFVIADKDVTRDPEWIDKDSKTIKALRRFKSKVKKKMISPWRNASELRALFVESLTTAINLKPRPGWVRAPDEGSADIAQALSNLTEENARLRTAHDFNSMRPHSSARGNGGWTFSTPNDHKRKSGQSGPSGSGHPAIGLERWYAAWLDARLRPTIGGSRQRNGGGDGQRLDR